VEMFCDHCGRQVTGMETFCASCGKQVNPVSVATPGVGRVEGHVRMLGIFWLAYSTFRLMGGWFFSRFFTHWSGFWNPHIPFFIPGVLRGIGMILMASGVLGILAGWGLIDRQPWARALAIVLGFFVLLNFGIGTVLGIYTLWVLLPAESGQEYQRTARSI